MASEDEVVILGRFRDEVSGGLEQVEHQIKKTGHATEELATVSEAAASALDRAAEKGGKFKREMSELERQLNATTAAEIRLLAAEKAAAAARKDPVGVSADDRVKAEKELAKARAELTLHTKALAKETDNLEIKTRNLGGKMLHAVSGTRALTAGLIGLGSVAVSGALASAAQLVSGLGAAAVAGVGGLAPLVGLLGGLPSLIGTLGTAMVSFKILSGGIGDAFKALTSATTTAQQMDQALLALGPHGMVLIGPMRSLAQQFRSIRSDMQGAAFPQFARAMTALGPIAAVVGRGLVGMSRAIGDIAEQGAKALSSGPWRADVGLIMGRNVTLFRTLASAGGSIANVFRNIAVAAGPMVQMLADAFRGWTRNLDAWFQAKRDSGALEAFFTRTGRLAIAVAHVLGNFGAGLVAVFRGAAPLGDSMGKSLTTISEQFRAWTESPAGQARIHRFFTQMVPVVKEVGRAVGTIVGGFLKLAENGSAASLLHTLENILKTVLALVDALAKVNHAISRIPLIGGALSGGLDALALGAMFGPTRKLGTWAGKKGWQRFAARGAGRAAAGGAADAAAMAGEAGVAASAGGAAAGIGEAGAIGGVMAAEAAVPVVGWIALGVTAAAVGVGVLYAKWKPFHNAVNATGRLLKNQFVGAAHEITAAFRATTAAVSSAGSAISRHTPGWLKSAGHTAGSNLKKWIEHPFSFFAGGQTPVDAPFRVGELGPELFLTAGSMKVVGADGPELMTSSAPGFVVPNHQMEPVAQALSGATRGGDGGAATPMSVPIDMRGAVFLGIEDFERKVTAAAVRGVAEARRQKAERR